MRQSTVVDGSVSQKVTFLTPNPFEWRILSSILVGALGFVRSTVSTPITFISKSGFFGVLENIFLRSAGTKERLGVTPADPLLPMKG